MKNTVIKLRSRLDANVYNIETSSIAKILDYLVVTNNGRTYNVVETTAEIIEKISNACDAETNNTTNRTFAGIDTDEIFENIFGFKPDDDFETMAKKLTGNNPRPRPRRKKKIVRTPFGPITTWVDEEE